MKKPKPKHKIKPEVMWAAWSPEIGFIEVAYLTRKRLIDSFDGEWEIHRDIFGYRAVKVEIREAKYMEYDFIPPFIDNETTLTDAEMRADAEQEIKKQFEYLWEKYGITGSVPPVLIESFKEIALTWYMRGRFIE